MVTVIKSLKRFFSGSSCGCNAKRKTMKKPFRKNATAKNKKYRGGYNYGNTPAPEPVPAPTGEENMNNEEPQQPEVVVSTPRSKSRKTVRRPRRRLLRRRLIRRARPAVM